MESPIFGQVHQPINGQGSPPDIARCFQSPKSILNFFILHPFYKKMCVGVSVKDVLSLLVTDIAQGIGGILKGQM